MKGSNRRHALSAVTTIHRCDPSCTFLRIVQIGPRLTAIQDAHLRGGDRLGWRPTLKVRVTSDSKVVVLEVFIEVSLLWDADNA